MSGRRRVRKEPGSGPWPANMGAIYGALRPLDELGAKIESKWGRGRLETLVSPETAAKYGRVTARLDEAIEKNDPELVAYEAGIAYRGLLALDREATERSAEPMPSNVWTMQGDDGKSYRVVLTDDEKRGLAAHVPPDERAHVVSVEELLRVLNAWEMRIVKGALETFPGAHIKAVSPKGTRRAASEPEAGPLFEAQPHADLDDDIPF